MKARFHIALRNRCSHWLLVLALSALVCTPAHAQQDPHHTQYIFNGLSINPAYAGSRRTIAGTFLFRQQWAGFEGAPQTQSLSLHMPANKQRYGFGLTLINDQVGYLRQQWVQGAYALRLPLGPGRIALGLQGGLLNFRINWQDVRATDAVDQVFREAPANMLLPNVGTGLYYSSDRFYAGLSAPHLLASQLTENPAAGAVSQLYRHYYFTTGYLIGQHNQVKLKPSFLLKYIPGFPLQADFNLMALFLDRYWVGASFRPGDAVSFMLDIEIAKHFRLGYAYDYILSDLSSFQSGSHELYLGFELKTRQSKLKSPRYF